MRLTASRASAESALDGSAAAATRIRAQLRPAVDMALGTTRGWRRCCGSARPRSSVFTSVIASTATPARASAAKYGAMG